MPDKEPEDISIAMRKAFMSQTIKDNFMFGAVMQEGDNCKELLELILRRKLSEVHISQEKGIFYNPDFHGVRLDVYAMDIYGKVYDIEMQVSNDDTELRARYYHSQMDVELLLKGKDYNELPESYVIFICNYDPLKMGKFVYTIRNRVDEQLDYDYRDGLHTIFLSTKGENDEEIPVALKKFLDFVKADLKDSVKDYNDDFISRLQKSIARIKRSRDKEAEFMTLELMLKDKYKKGREDGHAEGFTAGRAEERAVLVNSLLNKYPANTVADMLDMSVKDVMEAASAVLTNK